MFEKVVENETLRVDWPDEKLGAPVLENVLAAQAVNEEIESRDGYEELQVKIQEFIFNSSRAL